MTRSTAKAVLLFAAVLSPQKKAGSPYYGLPDILLILLIYCSFLRSIPVLL